MDIYCVGDIGDYSASVAKISKQITKNLIKDRKSILAIVGDNFYDRGVENSEDTNWKKFEKIFSNYPIPIYAVLGNHDYLGNPNAQVGDARWNMPYFYYFVDLGNVGLWFIDTQILAPEEDGGEYHDMREHITKHIGDWKDEKVKHWIWLRDSLKENRNKQYKFIFGHFPIVSMGAYPGREGMEPLIELMEMYDVTAFVSGHDHNSQHMSIFHKKQFWINQLICGATIRHATYEDYHSEAVIGIRKDIYDDFFTKNISYLKIEILEDIEECYFKFFTEHGDLIYNYPIIYKNRSTPSPKFIKGDD